MDNKVKVSVMITTYNLENYIDETLESVMNQSTDFDFEILVGDDGSSDHTVDRVRNWMDKYPDKISLYIMDRDKTVTYNKIERASKNRVNLIKYAKGEYLIFLDGDDIYIDANKLKKQVDILDREDNRDCIACAHNIWIYWNDDKKKLLNCGEELRKISGKEYWRYGMYFHSDTVLFRNVFNGVFPDIIPEAYYDDNIIVFYLLKYGKIIYIPDVMANYRQLENSSWNSVTDFDKNIINLLDLDIEKRIDSSYYKDSVIRHLYSIWYMWLNRHNVSEDIRKKYEAQIRTDGLDIARQWIEFSQLSLGKRVKLTIWLFVHMFIFAFVKMKKMQSKYRLNY